MNFALSDEQEFLKEAARGALSRVETLEAARDGARRRRAARPVADRRRGRLARACSSPRPTAAPGSARSRRCSCSRSSAACSRACRCSATCRRPSCSTAAARRRRRRRAAPPARRAPRSCPARPPSDVDAGWTHRPGARDHARAGARASPTARVSGDGRLGARRARRRPPRRRARRRPRRARARRRRAGRAGRRVYDATRSLGHVTLDGAPATLLDLPGGRRAGRLVHRPGAARRRVARRRSTSRCR